MKLLRDSDSAPVFDQIAYTICFQIGATPLRR